MSIVLLTLQGPVPSKKNAWRHTKGRVYLPAQQQADIDALVIQAQSKRGGLSLKQLEGQKLRVSAVFIVPREHKDLDNVFTTILDVLQAAGIIQNDKLVRGFSVDEKIREGEPETLILISRLSTGEHPVDTRA